MPTRLLLESSNNRYVLFSILFLCIGLLPAFFSHSQADDIALENKEVELESLRSRIKGVRSNIDIAKKDLDSLLMELQQQEKAASQASARLSELKKQITSQQARLHQLEQDKTGWTNTLEKERQFLAAQIKISYMTGHHDFLKLLLNQEDPALIGRMVAYHDYYSRARAQRINTVKTSLQEINKLQISIKTESEQLEQFKTEQIKKLDEFNAYRQSRKNILDKLDTYITKQDKELQLLQRNEEELTGLLQELKTEQTAIQLYEELPPFNKLKGKLSWPVKGKLIEEFNAVRKGGKLRSHGVRISSKAGNNVTAISAGKVIFADWFRNLGLLLILDHGDGFMSLYGHNASLLKKPGDMVNAGEIIAKVGDTGGQSQDSLYFEIRNQGTPQNPALWCRR